MATKIDWVKETYDSFIKNVKDLDPTDPVAAIAAYFAKNASDELKARCKAEGKDAKACWSFIEAVARKALNGQAGHIDPGVVYAIAMHYFEDVPKDWRGSADKTAKSAANEKPPAIKKPTIKKPAQDEKKKVTKPRPRNRQGFFFDALVADAPAESEAK